MNSYSCKADDNSLDRQISTKKHQIDVLLKASIYTGLERNVGNTKYMFKPSD